MSIDMMRNASAREAGIIYLDHEGLDITTSKGVKWKVYGSPVRSCIVYDSKYITNIHLLLKSAPFYVQGAFQYDGPKEAKSTCCVESILCRHRCS